MLDHFKRDVRSDVGVLLFVMFAERRSFRAVFRCSDVLSGPVVQAACSHTNVLLVAQLARCLINDKASITDARGGANLAVAGSLFVRGWSLDNIVQCGTFRIH